MSQLFDALQKSESERQPNSQGVLASGPEVLEVAEREFQGRRSKPIDIAGSAQKVPELLNQFESIGVPVVPNEKLVCITDAKSLAAEKFRFLGLRLTHMQQRRDLKSLLITSSMAEEGKSMIAANIACALARRQEQKILLVEGDLRRPTLAKIFGLGHNEGISDYLQGQSATASIYELNDLGLYFMPAGNTPKDPLAAMQSGTLVQLMEESRSQFDWIVVDSPPILPLGDTSAWMRLIDGILLVTRPGKTGKKHLERGLEAIDQGKLIGAIINDSHDVDVNDYYHYYGSSPNLKAPKGKV